MAETVVRTGCQVNLDPNQGGKIVTTFISGTAGIKVNSIKFENDTNSNVYLTPNGSGKTFSINIRGVKPSDGSINQEITMKAFTINTNGSGFAGTLGNNGVVNIPSDYANTVFTGNIQLCVYINQNVGAYTGFIGNAKVTLTYTLYQTNCTAPTSVTVTRQRSVCTVSWSGASGGTNNPITSYGVIVNTTAAENGATTVNSGINALSLTSQPNGTSPTVSRTYYFGVRAQSSYNNSGYKWSGAITVPAKPSVTAGTKITDTDMDNLRSWINASGITDIGDQGIVYASHGNTYKSGLTAGTSKVEATWYNNAATGS